MADASWLPDPGGAHEPRYWDGAAWTEHVSDAGTTAQDPLQAPFPPPLGTAPPPPPMPPTDAAAPAAASGRSSWKDRLKQVAHQGKALADQGKQKIAEQSVKRTEQWANDPNTLWFGESKGAATSAVGTAKARYRITRERIWIESGLLGTKSESVPMWAVKDIDVRQAVWQQGKDIGDVVLTLEDPSYGISGADFGRTYGQAVLDDIESPHQVVEILSPLVSQARAQKTVERQSQYVHMVPPGAGTYGAPVAAPQGDMAEQLRRLGELRDAGLLTEEEFAAQKAKLLAG